LKFRLPTAIAAFCLCLSAVPLPSSANLSTSTSDWPQWRGPLLNGVSGETNLPVTWTADSNIAWKLPLPEWSGATPIVWNDYICLNVAQGDALSLWCVDRRGPTVLWKAPSVLSKVAV